MVNAELYMSTDYPLYNDGLVQTTWGGFKLDDVMSPLSVFRAARTSSYTAGSGSYIPLDKMLLNAGNAMAQCNNTHLVVQRTGVYFVSWSAASPPNTTHSVFLYVNTASLSRILLECGDFNGIEMSSQSLMLQLNAGDTLSLRSTPPDTSSSGTSASYSDTSYQTSLTGFLYEPVHGYNVAWSLGGPSGISYGPTNINFTKVFVDTSGAWNNSAVNVRVPVSGLYYVKISGSTYREYKLNMVLTVNNSPLMNVMDKLSNTCTQYRNGRSRSIITRLQQDDILTVIVPNGYVAWSGSKSEVLFAGFLVSP
jgi:hypothetical protein